MTVNGEHVQQDFVVAIIKRLLPSSGHIVLQPRAKPWYSYWGGPNVSPPPDIFFKVQSRIRS